MRRAIVLAVLIGLVPHAEAQTPVQVARPVVVELFTSQGCSSCPPADALLAELTASPDILPLAFHVTYWNGQGWRDPFSLDVATARQRGYQRLLGTETIYTPQMVVEGHTDVVGSDRAGVRNAIAAARPDRAVPMRVSQSGQGVQVDIGAGAGQAGVFLVGYDTAHRTAVARGENAGRQLLEANVVRSFTLLADWQGRAVSLASPVPAGEHLAVILQAHDGRILGAAVLPPRPKADG